jgi:hypothetical protein
VGEMRYQGTMKDCKPIEVPGVKLPINLGKPQE